MSRRYDFAMNKQKKKKKKQTGMEGFDLKTFGFNKNKTESEEPQVSVTTSPQVWPDLPPAEVPGLLDVGGYEIEKKPSQLGGELGSIKDRISKVSCGPYMH